MNGVSGHNAALQGYAGRGTTWARDNLGWGQPGLGITWAGDNLGWGQTVQVK